MNTIIPTRIATAGLRIAVLLATGVCALAQQQTPAAQNAAGREPDAKILRHFLGLSDLAARSLVPEPPDREAYRKDPGLRDYYMFFVDSYAVRALAVAYELTGRERYWDACRTWSDRMLRHQEKMIPQGAYYMNYHRKPGESTGQWFVADSGSIAMGVLATAARSKDKAQRERYVRSAQAYAQLVMDRFVRDSGGVTDGYWDKSDKEWWCSTALFSAAAFQLYNITGEERYKDTAMRAVDWLLTFEYGDTILYKFADGAPTTIFYVLEAYSSALPYLEAGSPRRRKVLEKFSQTVEWIADNQNREGTWDYSPDNWGVKLGGLPCHLLIYLDRAPDSPARVRRCISPAGSTVPFEQLVAGSAARALDYFSSQEINTRIFTQKDAFTLVSEGEKLCPGELYQKTSSKFPYKTYSEQELTRLLSSR
jgi:rhamnogalacturonyl hydrolase YesR